MRIAAPAQACVPVLAALAAALMLACTAPVRAEDVYVGPPRPLGPRAFGPGSFRPLIMRRFGPPIMMRPGGPPVAPMVLGPGPFRPGGRWFAAPGGRVCFTPAETRDRIATHGLTEPFQALRIGRQQGEALRARLCRWRPGEFVYEVAVLRDDGRIVHLYVDARTGKNVGDLDRQ